MKNRFLIFATALLAIPTVVSATTLNVTIPCTGNIDAKLTAALSQLYTDGDSELIVTLSTGSGFCTLVQPYAITGPVTVSLNGVGANAAMGMGGSAVTIFQVSDGARFNVNNTVMQSASHGVISVVNATLFVDQTQFSANQSANGGVITASNAALTITRSVFNGNASSLNGGAIAVTDGGSLAVSDTGFTSNFTLNAGIGDGGAIYASGVAVTIDRSLFSANKSNNNRGGAIYSEGASLTVRNATFNTNQAVNGGAIATVNPSTNPTLLNNVTLRADAAGTSGSELYVSGASSSSVYTISNSLVSGTCAGVAADTASHASIESPGNTCGFDPLKNKVSVADASLLIGVLADNGGPTRTILPFTTSPPIDGGGNDCEKVDQRDLTRNAGPCDVGALEVGATDVIFRNGFQ